MNEEKLELFNLFYKYHIPIVEEFIPFCENVECGDCKIEMECARSHAIIIIESNEISFLQEHYPELFI